MVWRRREREGGGEGGEVKKDVREEGREEERKGGRKRRKGTGHVCMHNSCLNNEQNFN